MSKHNHNDDGSLEVVGVFLAAGAVVVAVWAIIAGIATLANGGL